MLEALRESNNSDGRIAPRYLNLEQAGQYVGDMSANAVRHLVRQGELRRIGTRLFITRDDIVDLMRSKRS